MALRNQPYIPLYIQDFLTDEKLINCSAATNGVFIRLLCIMHKSERYGTIEIKAKYKQTKNNIKDVSEILRRSMPFRYEEIESAITELIEENVCYFDGDFLCQRRMMKDGMLSEKRAVAGTVGGKVGRNSTKKRFYNEPGFLYLVYDKDDKTAFKIGISKEPDKRIYGIIRKTNRKNLAFRRRWEVQDMGFSEQIVLDFYDDIRDGEWIFGDYDIKEIEDNITQLLTKKSKSKLKAKPEYEIEYESEYENTTESLVIIEEHKLNLFISEKFTKVSKLKKMTNQECEFIVSNYSHNAIVETLGAMENKKELLAKYSSCYLTLWAWLKRRKEDDVPKDNSKASQNVGVGQRVSEFFSNQDNNQDAIQ